MRPSAESSMSHKKSYSYNNGSSCTGIRPNFSSYFPDESEYSMNNSLCSSKLKQLDRLKARVLQGLSPEPGDLSERSLGLGYDAFPKIRTKAELKQHRKLNSYTETIIELLTSQHIPAEKRLDLREEKYRFPNLNGKTLGKILTERRQKDMDYNSKVFGKVQIGIHKQELPKYQENKGLYNAYELIKTLETHPDSQSTLKKSSNFSPVPTNSSNLLSSPSVSSNFIRNFYKKSEISKLSHLIKNCLKSPETLESDLPPKPLQRKPRYRSPQSPSPTSKSIIIKPNHIRSRGFRSVS